MSKNANRRNHTQPPSSIELTAMMKYVVRPGLSQHGPSGLSVCPTIVSATPTPGATGILPVLKRVHGQHVRSTSVHMAAMAIAPSRRVGCRGPLANNPQTSGLKLATQIAILNKSPFIRQEIVRACHGGALCAAQLALAVRSSQGGDDFCNFCVGTREPRNAKVAPVLQAGFVKKYRETPTKNAPQRTAGRKTFAAR